MRLDETLLYSKNFTDSPTVCFLAFWENGAPNIGWNIPHQWWYNIYLPLLEGEEKVAGKTYKEYYGKDYKLAYTYDTCDNNNADQSNWYHQTATNKAFFIRFIIVHSDSIIWTNRKTLYSNYGILLHPK